MSQSTHGQPGRADIAALESLRGRLMPLIRTMEGLGHDIRMKPDAPPDWPAVQRGIGSLSNALNSLQSLLNDDPATTEIFRHLHAYPMSPFPFEEPAMIAIANVLLRKKPDINEDKWILDRLAKAQEFAHVPGDWGIEPRKPKEEDSDDDEDEGIAARFKRQKGTLDEDQIAELWAKASDVVEEEMEHVGPDAGSESGSEASSPEDTTMGGTDAQQQKADPTSKKDEISRPLPLEVLHKFMTTGMVDTPQQQ